MPTALQSFSLSISSSGRISGFVYAGGSRFKGDYGIARLGGFSGHSVCSAPNAEAYVLGFKGDEGGGFQNMVSCARISRPTSIPANPASNLDLPQWGLVQSVARLAPVGTVDDGRPSHPCVTDDGRLAWSNHKFYSVTPDQTQDDCGVGSVDLSAHNPVSRKLTDNGGGHVHQTHNRTGGWCLPISQEIRDLHPALVDAEWFQGGCILSGAATASFGPSLFSIHGNATKPLMYFPFNNGDDSSHLPLQFGNDLPGYPGTGTGKIGSHQGPTKAAIVGLNYVVITACALGPAKSIGGDSVDAELFEWRLLVFDIRDMFPVLDGAIQPWDVRHYLEIPVYVTPQSGFPVQYQTDSGPVDVSPAEGSLVLPHISGVQNEDYGVAHKEWGLFFDGTELMLVRRGVDESNIFERPPVVYHLELNA